MAETNGTLTAAELVEIELDVRDLNMRFTPRELRLIREQTGRSYSQIMADETSDDRFTVAAWLKTRRDGHDIALADMDDVLISITNTGELDPTTAPPGAILPSSVASTG
jgi:hypothetical protein